MKPTHSKSVETIAAKFADDIAGAAGLGDMGDLANIGCTILDGAGDLGTTSA